VEHLHVRRHNLSLVLRLLASEGPRSRADVAKVTGLTRATVSSLVGELIDRGLLREIGRGHDQRVGRPATLVELDGASVVTLGVELNEGYTAVLAIDLGGRQVYHRRRPLDSTTTDVDDVVPRLLAELRQCIKQMSDTARRVVGVSVAVPGIADQQRGAVTIAPNLGWRHVMLADLLRAELGDDLPIEVDNEANLAVFAEHRSGSAAGASHMVYVLAADGVGTGIMADGRVLRGVSGGAGEMGHTTVLPKGALCGCGARGCWETVVGIRALLRSALPDTADQLIADRRISPEAKVAAVTTRANAHDVQALKALQHYAHWLGVGLANIVDAFNPQVVVLGGFLPEVAPWVLAPAMETFWQHTLAESAASCRIELSTLGFSSAGLGAAKLAAERVLDNPLLL
jgi:predicted NBD/HSP70 family sugar kinase